MEANSLSRAAAQIGAGNAENNAAEVVKVRRRQERSITTREKILKAATLEFAKSGFHGATTRSIAERAKVQHGLVIYHFGTKAGVWQVVMEQVLTDFHSSFIDSLDDLQDEDDVEKLRVVFRRFIRLSAARPELNWLMSHEFGDDTGRLSWLISRIVGQDLNMMIDLIRNAQRAGRYVDGDPTHLHYLFVGAATRIFMAQPEVERMMGHSPLDEAFLEKHIDLCERLFFRDPPAAAVAP